MDKGCSGMKKSIGLAFSPSNRMKFWVVLVAAAIVQAGVSLGQATNDTQNPKQAAGAGQTETLKPISTPDPAYPDQAVKEGIEGKVTLRIVVDEQGRVSQATAMSGPPALVSAAVSAVKMWRFEPPRHAPFITTAELSFGLPRECPGLASDSGQVGTAGRLVNRDGKVVAAYDDDFNNDLPAYPEKDRKAGVSGELVLLITLSATAQLQDVQVFKSLSPGLDQAALDAVRSWRFKRLDPKAPLENLRLVFRFAPMCSPRF
jgi:TonB family protein